MGLTVAVLSGCAAMPEPDRYPSFTTAAPRSILVVPPVNKSLDVEAPDVLLSTLSRPVGEKGFYVFPVNTTKIVLEQEGFYEAEQVHSQPPQALARLFGADAVLYVTINRWEARYIVFTTTVTVDFSYRIYSKHGVEIWAANQVMEYTPEKPSGNGLIGNILVAAVNAAATRAAPEYLPLVQQANQKVFGTGGATLPNGPYRVAQMESDKKMFSGKASVRAEPAQPTER
jgi:hypothetical protein